MNVYEQINDNIRSTWFILAGFVLFFLFIGIGFDFLYGVGIPAFSVFALIFGGASAYAGYLWGDKLVLSSTQARPVDPANLKEKQWQNVVEEMSIAAGIPVPAVYVIDDPDPNAFATGRAPECSSIAVTSGLLDTLDRDELQAVAAHEMSHIRNFDIRLMLIVAVLAGSVVLISDWARRSLFYGRRRDSRSDTSAAMVVLAIWLITVILAPIFSQIMAMFVSRRREYLADASGAELTRNPLALAGALEKIHSHAGPTRSISRGTAHLCIEDPQGRRLNSKEGWFAELFATHPPLEKRIEALKQMAYLK